VGSGGAEEQGSKGGFKEVFLPFITGGTPPVGRSQEGRADVTERLNLLIADLQSR